MHPPEPAKPLHNAQMCGSFYFYTSQSTSKAVGKMNKDFISVEESKDQLIGKIGNPERDAYEVKLKLSTIGAIAKQLRKQQNLTQEKLGSMASVPKVQISRIENGHDISLPTMSRIFQALGVTSATLDLGETLGIVTLW